MRILRAEDHKVMPWKNGGGVTREVASAPAPSGDAAFLWRLSLATIRQSGPFSRFPGIDRTIVALRGDPVELTVDGAVATRLEALGEPFRFSGDADVSSTSKGSETTDLNIMTLRGQAKHEMRRLSFSAQQSFKASHTLTMLIATSPVTVTGKTGSFDLQADDVVVEILQGEELVLSSEEPAKLYAVELDFA